MPVRNLHVPNNVCSMYGWQNKLQIITYVREWKRNLLDAYAANELENFFFFVGCVFFAIFFLQIIRIYFTKD